MKLITAIRPDNLDKLVQVLIALKVAITR